MRRLQVVASLSTSCVVLCDVSSGYRYANPDQFGGIWKEDSVLDATLPKGACECEEVPGSSWNNFRTTLEDELDADPSFSGKWVHKLCASTYGTLFQFASTDPDTTMVHVRGTECTAGLAAIAATCAQSAALRASESSLPSGWKRHEAVVETEGGSVGDYFGTVAVLECLRRCAITVGCGSVAHGPHGCHLKDRCSSDKDVLVSEDQRVEGYNTYFRTPCNGRQTLGNTVNRNYTANRGVDDVMPQLLDVIFLLDLAMQLSEKAVHCLDASQWPISVGELVANRVNFAEALLRSSGVSGPAQEMRSIAWTRKPSSLSFSRCPRTGAKNSNDVNLVANALTRAALRWTRRLNSEVGFWHILLNPTGVDKGEKLDRCENDAAVARRWVNSGIVRWSLEEDVEMCRLVDRSRRRRRPDQYGAARVLNVGSGPLAPAPLKCRELGFPNLPPEVPVVAADGLGRFYLALFDELEIAPPRSAAHCPVEDLRQCFPRNHFDIVYIRNALDHTLDPLRGIQEMLQVVRPGGEVLLRHARNEGLPGHFQVGLHQWSFDAKPVSDDDNLHFLIWSPSLRADATEWVFSNQLADDIRTELRPRTAETDEEPSEADNEPYVWVDIRKAI